MSETHCGSYLMFSNFLAQFRNQENSFSETCCMALNLRRISAFFGKQKIAMETKPKSSTVIASLLKEVTHLPGNT